MRCTITRLCSRDGCKTQPTSLIISFKQTFFLRIFRSCPQQSQAIGPHAIYIKNILTCYPYLSFTNRHIYTCLDTLLYSKSKKNPTKTKQTKKPKLVIKHGKAKSRYKSAQESYLIFSFSTYCQTLPYDQIKYTGKVNSIGLSVIRNPKSFRRIQFRRTEQATICIKIFTQRVKGEQLAEHI